MEESAKQSKTYAVDDSLGCTEKAPSDDWPFDCDSDLGRSDSDASAPGRSGVASSSCSELMIWVDVEPADGVTAADLVLVMRCSCSLLG